MKHLLSVLFFCLICQQTFSQSKYDSIAFQSPLDIPLVLAGNFAELRSNHFHTGIDIKTQGVEGKLVRSVEDGYVSRIKISHWGYGKVIYVTHPNGYTSVYAHLKSFNTEITKYIRSHQYSIQSETFDVNVPESLISLEKGEQIALSGNTGSSTAPHLHFEIRDTESENAVNPLLFKFKITDNIKPQLNGVKIYALNNGFIEGHHKDIKIPTVGSNGTYKLKRDVIEVDGEIAFAVHAIDRLNGANNKCGAFNIKLKVDDSLVFEQSLNQIDFSQNRYINAYKDYEEYHKNKFHYHRSFLLSNNPLKIYDSVKNDGKITFTDNKIHNIKYEVSDVYGNLSTVSFKVKHNGEMEKSDFSKSGEIDHFNDISTTLSHKTNDTIRIDDMILSYEDSTFYEDVSIPIYSEKTKLFQSNLYYINKEYVPVQKYFALMINASRVSEKNRDKALIAKISKNNIAKPLGGKFEDGFIKTDVRELGRFAIMLDTIPPIIKALNLYENKSITQGYNIKFLISDNLSGIEMYNVFIDDQWVLSNYEPRKNTLTLKHDVLKKIESGEHKLRVVVKDERKNKKVLDLNFKLL